METMRSDGNVLIPCESGARVLELMQILGKHWLDQKLGMYHLVFLSHMSYNIMEYARSQLEWMSDALAKEFYNGKPNPFDLGTTTIPIILIAPATCRFLPVLSLLISLTLLFLALSCHYFFSLHSLLYRIHSTAPMKVCTDT